MVNKICLPEYTSFAIVATVATLEIAGTNLRPAVAMGPLFFLLSSFQLAASFWSASFWMANIVVALKMEPLGSASLTVTELLPAMVELSFLPSVVNMEPAESASVSLELPVVKMESLGSASLAVTQLLPALPAMSLVSLPPSAVNMESAESVSLELPVVKMELESLWWSVSSAEVEPLATRMESVDSVSVLELVVVLPKSLWWAVSLAEVELVSARVESVESVDVVVMEIELESLGSASLAVTDFLPAVIQSASGSLMKMDFESLS